MKAILQATSFLSLIALVSACGSSEPNPTAQSQQPANQPASTTMANDHHDHGTMAPIGEVDLETLKVSAVMSILERPSQDLAFDINFSPHSSAPALITVWYGMEDEPATEQLALRASGPGYFHEHLVAPDPWNPQWKLWIKFDHFLDGETRVSFPIQSTLSP